MPDILSTPNCYPLTWRHTATQSDLYKAGNTTSVSGAGSWRSRWRWTGPASAAQILSLSLCPTQRSLKQISILYDVSRK